MVYGMNIQLGQLATVSLGESRDWPKKRCLLLIVIPLLLATISCRKSEAMTEPGPARAAAAVISEVDALYAGREELMKIRQGLVSLRHAQATEAGNYDLAWRLAKFNYYLGAHSTDSSEREKAFREGIEAGQLAVKLQGARAEGHFWLGANYGGNAELSVLSGFAGIEDIKKEMEAVLKIDEGYSAGSAYMVLGQVYLQAPKVLGGDTQKAIEYFQKGIRVGPSNALVRWHLAQAYADANRKEDAKKEIEALWAMKPEPGFEPEYKEAVQNTKELSERLK
jgi:tetratricopeptide (TPR) repeat protein